MPLPLATLRGAAATGALLAGCAAALLLCACGEGLPAPEEREGIVTLAPNITETVFALGEGDRVIGRTSFCAYPPEALDIPAVGGHLNPDLERITALAPELILLQGRHQKMAEFARRHELPVAHVDMDSIETIHEGIHIIGEILDRETEAAELSAAIDADLEAIGNKVADRERPRVLIITTRTQHNLHQLYTAGGPSFLSEMVTIAGGENIYADASRAYMDASKETVVMREPEVIIEFHAGENLTDEEAARYKADWNELPSLPAVQNDRVHLVHEPHSLTPGPRVAEITRLLAGLIHPDLDLPE